MRRTMLLVATTTLALLLVCGVAFAADPYGTLDASTLGSPENSDSSIVDTPRGQTFVALQTGQLTGAQLKLYRNSTSPEELSVEVWSVGTSGAPTALLASATVPAAEVPLGSSGLVSVNFDQPAPVRAGSNYALLASSQSQFAYGWAHYNNDFDPSTDIYADGTGMTRVGNGWQEYPNLDFIFATYVNNRSVIGNPSPAPGTTISAHRPTISATATDAETDLTESDVSLFVDGRAIGRRAFVYDSGTDRLTYKPPRRLESGNHKVKVVATDERGLTGGKGWRFTIR